MVPVIRIYTRVSTEEQAQEGFSLDAQRRACLSYCEAQSVIDSAWARQQLYTDEGISGRDTNRLALQQLMSDLQPGDTLLVFKLDRLTRSIGDLHDLLKTSSIGNWAIRSVTESLDTGSATGRAMVHLIGLFAQWERETIAERMRMGRLERARKGRRVGGHSNFGLCVIDGTVSIDERNAALVRDIFRWYLHEQMGLHSIAARLNGAQVAGPSGGRWRTGTLYKILRNPIYVGDLQYDGIYLPNAFPALIVRQEWERVQARLSRSGAWRTHASDRIAPRARTSRYLLTGLLKCATCGASMIGQPRGRLRTDGTRLSAYVCTGYLHQRACATRNEARTDRLDQQVCAALQALLAEKIPAPMPLVPDLDGACRDRELAEAALGSIVRKRTRAWDAYLAGDIPLDRWRAVEQLLAKEEQKLQGEVERLHNLIMAGGEPSAYPKPIGIFSEIMLNQQTPMLAKKAWLHEHISLIRVRAEAAWPVEVEIILT